MPELPEVETTIKDLQNEVLSRTFVDAWTDFKKNIKKPFEEFREEIKGKKIEKIWRRGKNIIFELSGGYSLLIHQKLSGHLLHGEWFLKNGKWVPKTNDALKERMNDFIHLVLFLDDGKMIALSDLRKFAKVELWKTESLKASQEFQKLGPEPLEKSFTFEKLKEVLKGKKGKIKQVLMNQEIIAGIGNIYADEILWKAKINPLKCALALEDKELKRIYQAIQEILIRAIKAGGTSVSDYRKISGERGKFENFLEAYRREGKKCSRCGEKIERVRINNRSAHFCPKCQKL